MYEKEGDVDVMEATDKNSVFIVDDEKSNIIALTHILGTGSNIYAAKNGPDAIDIAKEFIPDVILLGILMHQTLSHGINPLIPDALIGDEKHLTEVYPEN